MSGGVDFEPYSGPTVLPGYGDATLPSVVGLGWGASAVMGIGRIPAVTQYQSTYGKGSIRALGMGSDGSLGASSISAITGAGSVVAPELSVVAGYAAIRMSGTGTARAIMTATGAGGIRILGNGSSRVSSYGLGELPSVTGFGWEKPVDDTGAVFIVGSPGIMSMQGLPATYLDQLADGVALAIMGRELIGSKYASVIEFSGSFGTKTTTVRNAEDFIEFADAIRSGWNIAITDSVGMSDSATAWRVLSEAIQSALALVGTSGISLKAVLSRSDVIALSEAIRNTLPAAFTDSVGLVDSSVSWRTILGQLSDELILQGVCGSDLQASVAIASVLALEDEVVNAWVLNGADGIELSETISARVSAIAAIVDSIKLAATIDGQAVFTVSSIDTLELTATIGTNLAAAIHGADTLGIIGRLVVDGSVFTCWVINTESKGVSKWTNYPFNSFAQLPDGRWVGATDTGLHLLGGDDDAGTPITARIRTGLSDFGSRHQKRMPSMYLGYSSSGELGLKVVHTSETGGKSEDHYLLESRPAGSTRESRFKIGRGIKSVYYAYEIVGVEGSDFTLDVVEWYPLMLDRRIT